MPDRNERIMRGVYFIRADYEEIVKKHCEDKGVSFSDYVRQLIADDIAAFSNTIKHGGYRGDND